MVGPWISCNASLLSLQTAYSSWGLDNLQYTWVPKHSVPIHKIIAAGPFCYRKIPSTSFSGVWKRQPHAVSLLLLAI